MHNLLQTVGLVAGCVLLSWALDPADDPRPGAQVAVRVVAGDTLWGLAGTYHGDSDKRAWVRAAKRANGWPVNPTLQPGQTIAAPDWRDE